MSIVRCWAVSLGGDPNYSGALLHYHFGLNHVLCRVLPDVPVIGTLEINGWSFQDAARVRVRQD